MRGGPHSQAWNARAQSSTVGSSTARVGSIRSSPYAVLFTHISFSGSPCTLRYASGLQTPDIGCMQEAVIVGTKLQYQAELTCVATDCFQDRQAGNASPETSHTHPTHQLTGTIWQCVRGSRPKSFARSLYRNNSKGNAVMICAACRVYAQGVLERQNVSYTPNYRVSNRFL